MGFGIRCCDNKFASTTLVLRSVYSCDLVFQILAEVITTSSSRSPARQRPTGKVNQVRLVRGGFFTCGCGSKGYDEMKALRLDKCIASAKAQPRLG